MDFTLLPVHSRKHPLKDTQHWQRRRLAARPLSCRHRWHALQRRLLILFIFFIYVESRDIFGFLSPVILLLYCFTIPSNTSTWSCGAEVKWRLKRWATKSNRVHLKLCRGSTLTPSGHGENYTELSWQVLQVYFYKWPADLKKNK